MTLPYYNYYPSDMGGDTVHLSNEEFGAYQRLLNFQWLKGPFSEERAVRIVGSIATVLLAEFFKKNESNGLYENPRLAKERASAIEKHQKRVDAGRKGGNAKANAKQCSSKATAKPQQSSSNQNQNHIEEQKKPSKKKMDKFDPLAIELPSWLPINAWSEWVNHRNEMAKDKRLSTESRCRASVKMLEKLKGQGHDPVDVITNSIANGYQGLFPSKQVGNNGNNKTSMRAHSESWEERKLAEIREASGQ